MSVCAQARHRSFLRLPANTVSLGLCTVWPEQLLWLIYHLLPRGKGDVTFRATGSFAALQGVDSWGDAPQVPPVQNVSGEVSFLCMDLLGHIKFFSLLILLLLVVVCVRNIRKDMPHYSGKWVKITKPVWMEHRSAGQGCSQSLFCGIRFVTISEAGLLTPQPGGAVGLLGAGFGIPQTRWSRVCLCHVVWSLVVMVGFFFLSIYYHFLPRLLGLKVTINADMYLFPTLFQKNLRYCYVSCNLYMKTAIPYSLFSVLFAEEVKKLCATQFSNIFFLDWRQRLTETSFKTAQQASHLPLQIIGHIIDWINDNSKAILALKNQISTQSSDPLKFLDFKYLCGINSR